MNSTKRGVVVYDVLPNGTELERELCQQFRQEVESAVRWLPPGVTCGIGDLVTPRFWLPLDRWTHVRLGRFLAAWVANGELPLEFASPPKRSNKRYRLRQ